MAKRFICGGEKYYIGGPGEDTICLPIAINGLPEKTQIEGCAFLRRTSFHVSLVCIGKILEKHRVTIPDFVNKVVLDFCAFARTNDIALLRYRNDFRFVVQGERRSIVVFCDLSNLDAFFKFMNKKYGLGVEYPPTHVTLYTLELDQGIFLVDSDDMKQLTKSIANPGIVLE